MTKFAHFEHLFSDKNEIEKRDFVVGDNKIHLFFIDCLVDKQILSSGVLVAIKSSEEKFEQQKNKNVLDILAAQIIGASVVEKIQLLDDAVNEVLRGNIIIICDKSDYALKVEASSFVKRSIAEPPTSATIKGPREGFIEDIQVNKALIRKRLKTKALCVQELVIGKHTKTTINILYVDGVANPKVVNKVCEKLNKYEIDGIVDSHYIMEFLQEGQDQFFRKVGTSEKPDIVAAKMLEGRVAILVDGSPIVLTVPFMLFEDVQSVEDYYDIPAKATFSRIIRLVGIFISVLLPGLYVALESYHYKVLPINFFINLLGSLENISLPPMLEILFVLFLFDILNEASLRMPKQLGMALSIIGALILGDTAVQSGIISSPSIVVVAISGIALYIIPDQVSEATIFRSIFTLIGGIAGLYGLICGVLILSTYIISVSSFGTPYIAPFAPSIKDDKKDGLVKQPIVEMKTRPLSIQKKNKTRLKEKRG